MAAMEYVLAQLNVARLRHPLDAPEVRGFVDALEPINALADAAPGFVWRLQTEAGDATSIRAYDDEMLIVNLSVWDSIDALRSFVYDGDHLAVMRRRREWFSRMGEAYLVLWWVPVGTVPTPLEAAEKLDMLQRLGPTPDAFTLKSPFGPPGAVLAP